MFDGEAEQTELGESRTGSPEGGGGFLSRSDGSCGMKDLRANPSRIDSLPELGIRRRWQVSNDKGPSSRVESDELRLVASPLYINQWRRMTIFILVRSIRNRMLIVGQLQTSQMREGQLVELRGDTVVDDIVVDVPGSGSESVDIARVGFGGSDNDFLPEDGFKGLVEGAADEKADLDGLCVEELADEWADLFRQVEYSCHC